MTFQLPRGARLENDRGVPMILNDTGAAELVALNLRDDYATVRFEDGQEYRVTSADLQERVRPEPGVEYGNHPTQEIR